MSGNQEGESREIRRPESGRKEARVGKQRGGVGKDRRPELGNVEPNVM